MTIIVQHADGWCESFKCYPGDVIKVEGLKFSTEYLRQILNDPPKGKFSFCREGENIVVTREDS